MALKILHVASHVGNIGDDASHAGTRHILRHCLGPVAIDTLDIRKTYDMYTLPDRFGFDLDFAERANRYDLVVIGGGAFLDFDIAGTRTGLMMDIEDAVFDALHTPLLVTSVGCHARHREDRGTRPRISALLNNLIERERCAVQLRNDGSMETVRDLIGEARACTIAEVLDSGFFYDNDGLSYRASNAPYIVISTTDDQLKLRASGPSIDRDLYLAEMRRFVETVIRETELNIAFALHIFSDIAAVSTLLEGINYYEVSRRVTIMPYAQHRFGADQIFSGYRNGEATIGMRFHANVCSLAMGKPTLGLIAAKRSAAPHETLGLDDGVVAVNEPGFSSRIFAGMERLLRRAPEEQAAIDARLENCRQGTLGTYAQTLAALGFEARSEA